MQDVENQQRGEATKPAARVVAESPPRVARVRRAIRTRRIVGWVVLCAPMLAAVALDLARRGYRLGSMGWADRGYYALAALEGLVVWGLLLYAASRRRGVVRWGAALLFVVGMTCTLGGQAYFFDQYDVFLGVNVMADFFKQFADIESYLLGDLVTLLGAVALVVAARFVIRSRRRPASYAAILGPVLALGALLLPMQHRGFAASTTAVTIEPGSTQPHKLRPAVRHSLPVPALVPHPARPRNVLFLLLESVRADATCIGYDPDCRRTENTNKLLPDRFPLTQMRSMDSTTALSLSVLWTGTGSDASRKVMLTWPLIFDYAKAAGYDTAYWTSQDLDFGNFRQFVQNLGVSHFVSATELYPQSDLKLGAPERLLADRVNQEIGELKQPWMAVVHFSNAHYPYYVSDRYPRPFKPYRAGKGESAEAAFRNHYQNSVWQQDLHIAAIIKHLQATAAGKRTVIVYTSDHAEAFLEHGQTGHTFTVLEEETHVPAWIYAPPGTLSEEEEENLRAKKDAYNFHVDIAPTLLDLMGVWHAPGIAREKELMPGHSLLGPTVTEEPLALTNCGAVWSCDFQNWGYVQGPIKLESRAWARGWHCYDDRTDPLEQHPLLPATAVCDSLIDHAMRTFGRLPGGH